MLQSELDLQARGGGPRRQLPLGDAPGEQLSRWRARRRISPAWSKEGINVVVTHGNGPPGRHHRRGV